MPKFILTLFLSVTCTNALAQSPDPWWERSEIGLPQLLAEGWQISFYTNTGNRREYVLQHPTETGAWQCYWSRRDVFREEPNAQAPNGVIRVPNGVEHAAYCVTIRENG